MRRFAKLMLLLSAVVPVRSASAQASERSGPPVSSPLELTPTAIARADSALRALEQAGFSGVVLIASDGRIGLNKGYGMANRATRTPMSPSTVVQIGSNTKDFTTLAILQLAERGLLSLDDSLGRFFPSAPADRRGVTVHQLIHHMGGFDRQVGGDFEEVSRDLMISNAFRSRLVARPGERRSYSNTGYNLLAAIVEVASGRSYDEYVHERIVRPLGLTRTGFLLPKYDRAQLARGYRDTEDMGVMLDRPHAADGPYWNLRGSGGMLSTTADMLTFYRALFSSDRLVSPAMRSRGFARPPHMLAGSDLVNFFSYSSELDGREIIVAMNSMAVAPMRVNAAISAALAGAAAAGPQRVVTDGPQRVITDGPPRVVTDGPGRGGAGRPVIVVEDGPPRVQTTAAGPFVMPESPAGRAARAYLRAFNQGRPEIMRELLTASAPDRDRSIDQRVTDYRDSYRALGFITPVSVVASADTSITLQVNSVYEGPVTMTLSTEAAAPHRLSSVQFSYPQRK